MSLPVAPIGGDATPVTPLDRLAGALGPECPRLLMKRDDLLPFGLGGNKVRKMQTVAAEAMAAGADTLITCGGVQSNHARVTAAAGAALGLKVEVVLNGTAAKVPSGNARLDELFGATLHYVSGREERAPAMDSLAEKLRASGRKPFIVPLGASTATGAMGFARGVGELAAARVKPDAIVHSTSSGGTQTGLIAGCALFGVRTHVIGISADDPSAILQAVIKRLLAAVAERLGAKPISIGAEDPIEVDDSQVGGGYGVPTEASLEAQQLVARHEGILLDPVYTAKAMAGLIARIRAGAFRTEQTVLFWHTGGLPGYFTC